MSPADLLQMTASDMLGVGPSATRVFLDHRMRCPGCAFARFETLEEVARAHGIEPLELANSLARACALAGPLKGLRS